MKMDNTLPNKTACQPFNVIEISCENIMEMSCEIRSTFSNISMLLLSGQHQPLRLKRRRVCLLVCFFQTPRPFSAFHAHAHSTLMNGGKRRKFAASRLALAGVGEGEKAQKKRTPLPQSRLKIEWLLRMLKRKWEMPWEYRECKQTEWNMWEVD